MNSYQAMMMAAQGRQGQQGPVAQPVHHEGNPAYGRLEQAIGDIDAQLDGLPLGAPEYDDLVRMRQSLAQKRANISAAHDQLVGRKKGLDTQMKYGSIAADPGLESLERGTIPTQPGRR